MVEIWPLSVFYRAYFGTMKLKERFAFCMCLVCLLVPFLWLRSQISDENKHPLILSVSDTQSLMDEMDFNRVDHTHRQQRSNEQMLTSRSERKGHIKPSVSISLENRDEKYVGDVDAEQGNKLKRQDAVNDVDYEYDDPWTIWKDMVKSRQITSNNDSDSINMILEAMIYKPIVAAGVGHGGTQLKASLILEGNQRVVFKPMRYSRDYVIEGPPYKGFDRHNGEIAAFHLDRILQSSPRKNTCFYGVCYYCKKAEAACANGTVMEGSVTLWLPAGWPLKNWRHPWQRTYRDDRKALWEVDNTYCKKKVLRTPPYNSGPRLLDIMDTALFDFLIGNGDRHHYETFRDEGVSGMLLHLDNAKSFGNPYHDEMSILAPVYQCCKVRKSTWNRFLSLSRQRIPLSELLRQATKDDPVAPVLSEPQFKAIDRRLKIAMDTVKKCIRQNGESAVLVADQVA
ncbi:unnamed protein product [Porites lobata]|uniref:FAM20 C-terminal domain-containing protein n=1 Tax=Porites lobata TaxID=104759 RepID=A0ABN8N5L1_9CNID|nr:unnamed protein product [Porites lobata]